MTTFPELLDWRYSREADNHAKYEWHGYTIHCWDTGDGDLLAELFDADGLTLDASADGDVRWLAQVAAEHEEEYQ